MLHRLKSDASLMTDPSRDTLTVEDTGLELSIDLERCVRCGKCEHVCPVGAIMLTDEIPRQEGDSGYRADLRDRDWGRLGYPTR